MTKVEGAHTTAQDMKMVKLFPLLSTINRSWVSKQATLHSVITVNSKTILVSGIKF